MHNVDELLIDHCAGMIISNNSAFLVMRIVQTTHQEFLLHMNLFYNNYIIVNSSTATSKDWHLTSFSQIFVIDMADKKSEMAFAPSPIHQFNSRSLVVTETSSMSQRTYNSPIKHVQVVSKNLRFYMNADHKMLKSLPGGATTKIFSYKLDLPSFFVRTRTSRCSKSNNYYSHPSNEKILLTSIEGEITTQIWW